MSFVHIIRTFRALTSVTYKRPHFILFTVFITFTFFNFINLSRVHIENTKCSRGNINDPAKKEKYRSARKFRSFNIEFRASRGVCTHDRYKKRGLQPGNPLFQALEALKSSQNRIPEPFFGPLGHSSVFCRTMQTRPGIRFFKP